MKPELLNISLEFGTGFDDSEFIDLPLPEKKKKELNVMLKKYVEDRKRK